MKIKIAESLTTLARQRGESLQEISRRTYEETGIRVATSLLSDWSANRNPRSLQKVLAVARHFGVSLEFMLFGVEHKKESEQPVSVTFNEIWSGDYEVTLKVSKIKKAK